MNATEWIINIHALAKSKGWWDTERPVGELFALVHSEASEALEALRSPEMDAGCDKCEGGSLDFGTLSCRKCGGTGDALGGSRFLEELADVQIRVMDIAGRYGVDLSDRMGPQRRMVDDLWKRTPPSNLADAINSLHDVIGGAALSVRLLLRRQTSESSYHGSAAFARVLAHVDRIASEYGCDDLEPIIAAKHAFNRTRPVRHGKVF